MKVKLAVIGSGFGLYGLLPAFQQLPSCTVVGIYGKKSERLLTYCQRTSVPVFDHWQELVEREHPDAIAIAVVPKYQYEIARFALASGISVFAEKPLCTNLEQATGLLDLARRRPLAHMVDFIFPAIPEWAKTKDLLEQGIIGKVKQVKVRWSFITYDLKNNLKTWKSIPAEGGGALSFYFSHELYNLEFFLGPMVKVRCDLKYGSPISEGETGIALQAEFASGCIADIVFDCASPDPNFHALEFLGESGILKLSNASKSFTGGFQIELAGSNQVSESVHLPPPQTLDPALDERVYLVKTLADRFIQWCSGGAPARPDFSDGWRVQHLIEACRISDRDQKTVAIG